MARPALSAFLILSFLIQAPAALADDPHCDLPLKGVLKMIGAPPARIRAIHYNDLIAVKASEVNSEALAQTFDHAIAVVHPIMPGFPREEFIEWYKSHPYLAGELSGQEFKDKTVGQLMNEKAVEFAKTLPEPEIEKTLSFVKTLKKSVKNFRKKNPRAGMETLWDYMRPKVKMGLPCLFANPKISVATAGGFLLGNLSATAAHFTRPKEDRTRINYPTEGALNGVIWTLPVAELSCRINRKLRTEQGGLTIEAAALDRQLVRDSTLKMGIFHRPQAYPSGPLMTTLTVWGMMNLTSPFEEATYTAMHLHFEKERAKACKGLGRTNCKEPDTSFKHLLHNYETVLFWDLSFASLRKALVRPVYEGYYPDTLHPLLANRFGDRSGNLLYYGIDGLTRLSVSTLNAGAFLRYQKYFMDTGAESKSNKDSLHK